MHKLTEWCIEKIKRDYPDDVALLIGVKGHNTDHDLHGEVFDYFVPCTDRGNELSRTFIVEGVAHDLYPRSWERLQKSVDLDEMALVLKNATVLYARTEEDEERFLNLKKELSERLADKNYTYKKAAECLVKAQEVFTTLMFEEKAYRARNDAAGVLSYLSEAVAFLNGTCADDPLFSEKQAYDPSPESAVYACPDLVEVPDNFFTYARELLYADTVEECRKAAEELTRTTRKFIRSKMPGKNEKENTYIDYEMLRDFYHEMSLTWKRIRYYVENDMVERAYCDAVCLQRELIAISSDSGIQEYNILDSFDPENLELLKWRTDRVEKEIVDLILEAGLELDKFDTLEEFLGSENM